MIVRATTVIGAHVYTKFSGKDIEKVDDIIYDSKNHHIVGLLVDEGGILSSSKVILMSEVDSIGKDAVIVDNEDAVRKTGSLPKEVADIVEDKVFVTHSKVITEAGDEIGRVTDVVFDTVTGQVKGLEVSEGALHALTHGKKLIKPDDIITIGDNVTIIKSSESKP